MQPTAKTRVLGTAACATLFVAVALTRGTWPGEARGTDDKPPTPAAPVADFVVGPYLQYATKTAIKIAGNVLSKPKRSPRLAVIK